jgi:hypothetical protein
MMDDADPWAPLHARVDGSFVVRGPSGPYHVTVEDPLYAEVVTRAASLELPPEPAPSEPALPQRPAEIAKTTIYRRATDEELAIFLDFLQQNATPRQRLMWEDAAGGMVLVEDVRPVAEALFGEERAVGLLERR